MIALRKKKTCFVCIPKNATHTIYHHLKHLGGRRIGRYHEYLPEKIPRDLLRRRYHVVMVWRDPVERALSLFGDIVLREQQGKRKVGNPKSVALHEAVSARCSSFAQFVNFLCQDQSALSEFLFRNQAWWYERIEPDEIIPQGQVSNYLEQLTGVCPETRHTGSDLDSKLEPDERDKELLRKVWAAADFEYKP